MTHPDFRIYIFTNKNVGYLQVSTRISAKYTVSMEEEVFKISETIS